MAEETQDALVARAREGDAEAFSELYRRGWPMMYLFVAKYIADKDEARSVVQEVFVRAYERLETLRDNAAFPGFLRGIALHVVQDARARRMPTVAEPPPQPDPGAADPADSAERAEFERALFRALGEFEPVHQEAIYLRLVQGLKYREVAERLGLRLDQASGIIERGILKLADRLSPFFREDR